MVNENQNLTIDNLKNIMELFSIIIDINQMDLGNFLLEESKIYYRYFYIKVIAFISFCIILTTAAIIDILRGVSPYTFTILDIILTLIYFVPIIISLTFALISISKFKYSIRFYRKQVKFMSDSYIKLQSILNFHTLSKVLGDLNLDDCKKNLKEIKNKIDFGSERVPSFFKSLKRVGIISFILSILSSGFNYILQILSNSKNEYDVIFSSEGIVVLAVLGIVLVVFLPFFIIFEKWRLDQITKNKKNLNKKKEELTKKIEDFSEHFRNFLNFLNSDMIHING